MRSDGEINKEEFLKKKAEFDKKLLSWTQNMKKDDCTTESGEVGLELSKADWFF